LNIIAQEQQQELEIQAWLELDHARQRRLEFVNACIAGLDVILEHIATSKLAQTSEKYFAPFELVVISPKGNEVQPFLGLKNHDYASVHDACSHQLARLREERSQLDLMTLCLTNMPTGAWAYKLASSSTSMNNQHKAPPLSTSSASASAPAPSAPFVGYRKGDA